MLGKLPRFHRLGSWNSEVMQQAWHVKEQDGHCFIWLGDGLIKQIAPRSWLKQQMAPHGVMGDDYNDLCRQLDKTVEATITVGPLGQFFQL